jgi:hypothetical protein
MIDGLGTAFQEVAKRALVDKLPPALFGTKDNSDSTVQRQPSNLPIKAAGLAILDPATPAIKNWLTSSVLCSHLATVLCSTVEEYWSAKESMASQGCMLLVSKKVNWS